MIIGFLLILSNLSIGICQPDSQSVADLESKAKQLDFESNVTARVYVDTYFNLAEAYLEANQSDKAMEALIKGLRLESWNYKYQLLLAKLEIETKLYITASERLEFVARFCEDSQYLTEAQSLLNRPELIITRKKAQPPTLPDQKLYIVKYKGVNPIFIQAVASRIFQEYGFQVEVLKNNLKPDAKNLRNGHQRYYDWVIDNVKNKIGPGKYEQLLAELGIAKKNNETLKYKEAIVKAMVLREPDGKGLWKEIQANIKDQYDADILLQQIEQKFKKKLAQKNIIGILGITAEDIYSDDYNFLFGNAKPRVGVISYSRFYSVDTPLNTVIKRTVMQAFSSTGFIIGIPRCTTPTCARAYPHSLEEHDRKEDKLCRECIANLRQRYREIGK